MSKLSVNLRQQAVRHGLCRLWRKEWSDDCSEQELIDKFKKGLDFCIANDFPDLEVMHRHFDRGLLHRNLIFVDETVSLDDAPNGVYVLNGACTGVLRFRSWAAATVYVRHSSHIHIIAEDFAKVFVRLYDGADADICDLSGSVVKVYDRR